ncbi:DNA starvation/stationary phase protection protein [Tessaracoccus sp. SD287]|uniref:Dps family protein n=1 Tax=Tessaracoccus sp. SD287 TaxID=2782008 RepID=UPI001A97AB93|nr:DNA starvation/stationary phase protection protein [Tessaracoccus sp. SD287]MBO1030532.1 DNA starvation/stationary phase protection protein [Tessaracoccus sp. SD287]
MATTKKAAAKTTANQTKSTPTTNPSRGSFTVPGLSVDEGQELAMKLQMRLHALNDLQLTLKHAHWNVVGPKFIGVHQMLDPQVAAVRAMVDETAERMATMGVAPNGCPGALVAQRTWQDYPIGQAQAAEHLGALDVVYVGIIEDHRELIEEAGDIDPITEDMLIAQVAQLEQFQWFLRAHLEDDQGNLATDGVVHAADGAAKGLAADASSD